MAEYNLKGMYEPGSLDEVVGEVNEPKIFSKSRKEIIIRNAKVAAPLCAGSFLEKFSAQYFGSREAIPTEDLLFRTLVGGGIIAGIVTIINYTYKRNCSKALELVPGAFVGFAAGYNLGYMLSTYLK